MPTDYSIYCLQQDPHYRGDCTTRGYYQHPNTSFYLGEGMLMPPLPPVFEADMRWKGNGQYSSFDLCQTVDYADGKSVMFDLSGDNSATIVLEKPLSPSALYVMNPNGHDYTFSGKATTGNGSMIKSMLGKATFNGDLGHNGTTIISEGTLCVNGQVQGPVELRAKGTLAGNITLCDTITFEGALNYEGCRLMPGAVENTIISRKSMTLPGEVYLEIHTGKINAEGDGTQQTPKCGKLMVEGNLTFKNTNYITMNLHSKNAASYVIAECTGTLTCDVARLQTRGLEGVNYDLMVEGNKLMLIINDSRKPATGVVWTGNESDVWDYKSQNFQTDEATSFVAGDAVVFNDEALQKNLTLNEMMLTDGVTFNAGKYTLSGEGGISGVGGITVNSDADVTLNMKYSDYTGATIINGGKLTVPNFYDGGQKSALGAATAAKGNLVMNGGTLVLSKDNMATDRQLTVTDTATISIQQANSSLSLKGFISGTGYIVKDGAGQLNLTYGGANTFAGIIVKKGIVAQGAWNATFGRSGSPMVLAGGEVHQIDVNSVSTIPTFNHVVTVQEGTNNKIVGSSRGSIKGSVNGKGNLTIQTRYVRCDIGLDFKNFEGTLTAKGDGGNFRLMSNVTDMSKARLTVDAGTTVAHYAGGSNNAATATLKIGTLQGTAKDGVLGGTSSSYQVGYLNENSTFAGLLQASQVTKVGTGVLTLSTAGHTSPITVNGGVLEMRNLNSTAMTSGTITVGNGGTLRGNGMVQNVVVNKGGTITGGISSIVSKLKIGGNLTMNSGATLLCKLSASNNSQIAVTGNITHKGDTILLYIPSDRTLMVDDVITVVSAASQSGEFILKVESENAKYEFDTSSLLIDGKVRVVSVVSGIDTINNADNTVDVYTLDGRKLRSSVASSQATDNLPSGVYVLRSAGKDGKGKSYQKVIKH